MNASTQHSGAQKPPKRVFFAAMFVIFFSALSVSDSFGFVPYYMDGSASFDSAQDTSLTTSGTSYTVALSSLPELGEENVATAQGVEPSRIKIAAIGLDLPVQNPATRDVEALDVLLQKGPARYVDSALLGEKGNMIIFAHSSHLPLVHNKMYQAFNDIPELKAGDSITLEGGDGKNYLYTVNSVAKASVGDGTTLDLSPSQGIKLTLVTCDTLTGKSARYILEADFVGVI